MLPCGTEKQGREAALRCNFPVIGSGIDSACRTFGSGAALLLTKTVSDMESHRRSCPFPAVCGI